MIVRLKNQLAVVTAETPEEQVTLAEWVEATDSHAFALTRVDARTFRLSDLGPRADACREPINVTSRATDTVIRLISNLAHTPFELDGNAYASVEAFWQGLKFTDAERRRQISRSHGLEARSAGFDAETADTLLYRGRTIRVGTSDHWRLMYLACRAKFSQHEQARTALVGTGDRPLIHKTRRDSRTIPGVVRADIWNAYPPHFGAGEAKTVGRDGKRSLTERWTGLAIVRPRIMTRGEIGLSVLTCGIAFVFLGLYGREQGFRLFVCGVGVLLLFGGLCMFLFTLRGATVSRPHWAVIVVAILAVALHAYEHAFERPGEFSAGWLLWTLTPYGLCLVASAFSGTRVAAIAGALVALSFDLVVHYDVFMHPGGFNFASAFVLIFAPLCNTLVFSPLAIFIAWWFLRRRNRPGHDAP